MSGSKAKNSPPPSAPEGDVLEKEPAPANSPPKGVATPKEPAAAKEPEKAAPARPTGAAAILELKEVDMEAPGKPKEKPKAKAAQPAEAPEEGENAPATPRSWRARILMVLFIAASVVAIYGTQPWRNLADSGGIPAGGAANAPDARVAALENTVKRQQAELANLRDEVFTLKASLSGTEENDITVLLQGMEKEIASLRATVAALPKTSAAAPSAASPDSTLYGPQLPDAQVAAPPSPPVAFDIELSRRLALVESKLEELQAGGIPVAENDSSLIFMTMFAFGNLRDAIQNGRSFAQEWGNLKAVLPPEAGEALGEAGFLDAYAEAGIPSFRALADQFRAQAKAALLHWRKSQGTDDLLGKAAAVASEYVMVRKVGAHVEGSDPEAILARAEAAMDAQDLTSAVEEISALPQTLQRDFSDWLALAQARLEAEEALANLQTRVLSDFVGVKGEGEGAADPKEEQPQSE